MKIIIGLIIGFMSTFIIFSASGKLLYVRSTTSWCIDAFINVHSGDFK